MFRRAQATVPRPMSPVGRVSTRTQAEVHPVVGLQLVLAGIVRERGRERSQEVERCQNGRNAAEDSGRLRVPPSPSPSPPMASTRSLGRLLASTSRSAARPTVVAAAALSARRAFSASSLSRSDGKDTRLVSPSAWQLRSTVARGAGVACGGAGGGGTAAGGVQRTESARG